MAVILTIASLLLLALLACLETIESKQYDNLMNWKRHPRKCYRTVAYYRFPAGSMSECKAQCGKQSMCKTVTFERPICSLSKMKKQPLLSKNKCHHKFYLYEKVITKKLRPTTKPATTKPKTTRQKTTTAAKKKHEKVSGQLRISNGATYVFMSSKVILGSLLSSILKILHH